MSRSKSATCFLAAILLSGLMPYSPVNAEPPAEPWEWTVEQRLYERFDPEAVERRRQQPFQATESQVIDGRDEPGLFLPWELFDSLVFRAYAPDADTRQVFRAQIENNLASAEGIELPENLWERLGAAAHDFIAARHEELALAARLPGASPPEAAALRAEIEEWQEGGCLRRRLALHAAEEELGSEILLRILYQGIAPDTFIQESTVEGRGDVLLYVRQGCS